MAYTVTVLGLGFVGLTTALAFAEKGNKVYGYDIDRSRLDLIGTGKLPFVEPGLDTALLKHLNKNFAISNNPEDAVKNSDFVFLCVGTPCDDDGQADLRYIFSAIDSFASVLDDDKFRVIIVKSTVPPSTTSEKVIPYLKAKGLAIGEAFSVANNPEFLREGYCWDDAMNADRIVCGVADQKGEKMLRELYSNFDAPFFSVSLNTGEFIKYLSNTLLATMISYSNEMSIIASVIGDIQIKEAFKILHLDRRWGGCNMSSYVYPGCGYGGYCLPKDTRAMYQASKLKGYEPMILKNVIDINDNMPQYIVDKIKNSARQTDRIGILGLSFKPGSDDVRDSSAAKIIKILIDNNYKNIIAYDPIANESFDKEYRIDSLKYCKTMDELCQSSDVIVLVTAWKEFYGVDKKYPDKRFVDCRYYL